MTRAQFLNDLYRRLCGNGLNKDQAEQHLTYYAEMLADRMEEGMTEDQAVAGMEDVETITRRILEEEGRPYRPPEDIVRPPEYPDASRLGGGGGKRAYQVPKKWSWQRTAQVALWVVAAAAALGAVSRLIFGIGWSYRTDSPRDTTTSWVSTSPDLERIDEAASFAWEYEEGFGVWDVPYTYGYEYNGGMNSYGASYVNQLKKLDIEWAAGTVWVQGWSGEDIQIQEYAHTDLHSQNGRGAMAVESGGGDTLTIRYRENASLGNVKGDKWLTVLVPDGVLEELEIETTSADVHLEGLELGEIDAATMSGDVNLINCYARKTEIETVSGGVDVSGLYADELDVSTTSGDVCGDVSCGDIEASSASGKITLYANDVAEKLDVETVSGEIYLNAMGSSAVRSIRAESVSGYISIGMPYEVGFTLDFSTVSGALNNASFNMVRQNDRYVYNGGGCEIEVETISSDLELY